MHWTAPLQKLKSAKCQAGQVQQMGSFSMYLTWLVDSAQQIYAPHPLQQHIANIVKLLMA